MLQSMGSKRVGHNLATEQQQQRFMCVLCEWLDYAKQETENTSQNKFAKSNFMEKTLENPLDCKEIQPVHLKGNQS